jgi:hypothetical protein
MFGIFKKKEKETKKEAAEEAVLTEERKEELLRTISSKKEEVNLLAGQEQSKIYEEIGLAFNELGDEDNAIDAFEKSLQAKNRLELVLKFY